MSITSLRKCPELTVIFSTYCRYLCLIMSLLQGLLAVGSPLTVIDNHLDWFIRAVISKIAVNRIGIIKIKIRAYIMIFDNKYWDGSHYIDILLRGE